MNQQQCKILYDFGGHLENMQISSIIPISQLANIGFRIKHTKLPWRIVSDSLSSEKSPHLILLKFILCDSVFCEYKIISPFSMWRYPFLSVLPKQKLSISIYLQLKTSFILNDDEVNFLNSIQKLRLTVYQVYWWNVRKQSIFHTGVATLQAIFRAVKHVRMLVIMFLKSKLYFFRVDIVLRFFTKNDAIIRNDIEENVLFYRVVRVIPH